ncbi:hypothetical protein [Caballeronia telluris]|nr:hypothetical protein [Caballeronia telluris]
MQENKMSDIVLTVSRAGGLNFGNISLSVDENGFATAKVFRGCEHCANGGGIFNTRLDSASIDSVRKFNQIACASGSQAGRPFAPQSTDPAETFTSACTSGDGTFKLMNGSLSLMPKETFEEATKLLGEVISYVVSSGSRRVKLSIDVSSIQRSNDGFRVGVDFYNAGERVIKFKRPDLWKSPSMRNSLSVGGLLIKNGQEYDGFDFELITARIVGVESVPEWIFLQPSEKKTLVFITNPNEKFEAGEYRFGVAADMELTIVDSDGQHVEKANLVSDEKSSRSISFDHAYPLTPQEREQWEATHRATMSSQPVKPGEAFAEDGLYRAVALISGIRYRSLQVKPFKAGDVATTENVKMPMDNGSGININGPVQWEWQATAPTPVKQWSFDMIDDTRQFCAAGSTCPRSGRWVPRINAGSDSLYPEYRHELSSLVTLRRGQPMPLIKGAGERADWEWVGA